MDNNTNTTPDVHDDDLYDDDAVTDELELDAAEFDSDEFDNAVDAASAPGGDPTEQLGGLVRWLVDQLVDEPENVTVEAVKRGSSVQVQVRLPEADLGKVIGRGGRIAKSIRTALMIVGSRHHVRVSLDIEGQE